MSKSTTIAYGDRWIWAYDLARTVLLVEVIHVAGTAAAGTDPWVDEVLADVRVGAEIGDSAFGIDPAWGAERLDMFVGWLDEAGRRLRTRVSVGPGRPADWPLDGFEWRGSDPLPVASAVS
ncbi:hypothetical protein ACFQ07_31330, partial [Actinomadura adrarensis]